MNAKPKSFQHAKALASQARVLSTRLGPRQPSPGVFNTPRRPSWKSAGRPDQKPGFTFLEIGVVIFIMAIIIAVGYPSFHVQRAASRLKADASKLENSLRQARALSKSLGAPVRIVLDCSKDGRPCASIIQTPVLDKLEVKNWQSLAAEKRAYHKDNAIAPETAAKTHDGAVRRTGVHWAIFLPGGRVLCDPKPFGMLIADKGGLWPKKAGEGWLVSINHETGRIASARVPK